MPMFEGTATRPSNGRDVLAFKKSNIADESIHLMHDKNLLNRSCTFAQNMIFYFAKAEIA